MLYCNPAPTYDSAVYAQIEVAKAKAPKPDMNELLRQGHTWRV